MIKLDTNTIKVIAEQISMVTGCDFQIQTTHSVSGGDINAAFRLQGASDSYFVKLNHADKHAMFQAEFAGLQALAETHTVTVPKPLAHGVTNDVSFLVLEHLVLNRLTGASEQVLGQQLAQLHLQRQPYFGWHIDNTIGSTPQVNSPTDDWIQFWRQSRLGFQLNLVISHGYGKRLATLGGLLSERLSDFFHGYTPLPSLLHGDLWAGNAASLAGHIPVVFDPACYFGDRETDLAMTELFGGFGHDFYAAYNDVWQLDAGYSVRRNLYNLYHVLNHVVLFGGGYVSQAEKMMQDLLREVR
jgi:protein-ribulosamine 3-kinase